MKAYATKINRKQSKIVAIVEEFFTEQKILNSSRIMKVQPWLFAIAPDVEDVPQWNHPLVTKQGEVFIDIRPHVNHEGRIKNQREYDYLVERAMLEHVWNVEPEAYDVLTTVLPPIFAQWVCAMLASRFNAEYRDIEVYRVIMIIYYWFLMQPNGAGHETEADVETRILRMLTQKQRIPLPFVEEILSSDFTKELIKDFVKVGKVPLASALHTANALVESPTINLDDSTILIYLVDGSWFGFAGKELATMVTEHPPTLVHMLNLSLTVGMYRKTKIGGAVESIKRSRAPLDTAVRWLREMKEEYYEE